jgi:phosphatidylglycerophosphate synthase
MPENNISNLANRFELQEIRSHCSATMGQALSRVFSPDRRAEVQPRAERGSVPAAGWKNATRIQQSISSAVESRVLAWLAARTPVFVNSDHLTALGLLGQFAAGAGYALARWTRWGLVLATVALAVNWLGDSLDGTLARFRQRQRPRYGFYVDHVIDTLGALFLMGGLALSGYIHAGVAVGMLVVFLMLSCEVYLATYTLGNFRLSYGKLGPTEIRILLAIGNCVLLWHPGAHLFGREFLLFDVGGVIAIAGMGVMFLVSSILHTIRLYREERF